MLYFQETESLGAGQKAKQYKNTRSKTKQRLLLTKNVINLMKITVMMYEEWWGICWRRFGQVRSRGGILGIENTQNILKGKAN